MTRPPSKETIEMTPGGTMVVENILIEDIGNAGGQVTWNPPSTSGGGGIAQFTISAYHAELVDDMGTVLARVPELPQEKAAINSATFADYPNNPNRADYNPQNPPTRVRIVSYTNTGMAHSSIIIEDIVMKDDPQGLGGFTVFKKKR